MSFVIVIVLVFAPVSEGELFMKYCVKLGHMALWLKRQSEREIVFSVRKAHLDI